MPIDNSAHNQSRNTRLTELAALLEPLPPNSTIGIIGGGQLGRMLASAAARLGFRTVVLEPGKDCPAAQICNRHIVAAYDDEQALAELTSVCDVITYEFENVPLVSAARVEAKVPLYPPSGALEVSQDRLLEKQFLQSAGLEVAPFRDVIHEDDLAAALDEFGGGVLKTRRFGYDGKGQQLIESPVAADPRAMLLATGEGPYVMEKKVEFISEFSVIAARSISGKMVSYDPATNEHEGGILRRSSVPSRLPPAKIEQAFEMAQRLVTALDYIGVIGIEFFDTQQGLLINEFAPRVHNSGHWTREACAVSQFEQHIRAVTGLPLGSAKRYFDCEMINLLGSEADSIAQFAADPLAHVTLYGKCESRPGRKMGHVTRLLRPC